MSKQDYQAVQALAELINVSDRTIEDSDQTDELIVMFERGEL